MRFNSNLAFYLFLSIIFIISLKFVQSSSLNDTKIEERNEFMNGTESDSSSGIQIQSNSRNSRQLWSLFKNVVKSSLEKGTSSSSSNNNYNTQSNPVSGLGALASLLGSTVSSASNNYNNNNNGVLGLGGINSDYNGGQLSHTRPFAPPYSPPPPNQYTNPNEYMHWLLLNSQQNQHASVPHYQLQQQQKKEEGIQELIEKYKEQMHSSASENVEIGQGGIGGASANTGSQILNKLAFGSILDNIDLDNLGNLLSFGRFEDMIEKVNKFDRLKCIPRLLCQMVAKRQEDAKTATTTTARPSSAKRRNEEANEDDDDDDDNNDKEEKEKKQDDVKEAKDITEDKSSSSEKESRSESNSEKLKSERQKSKPKKNSNTNSKKNDEEEDEDVEEDDDDDDESIEEDHKVHEYEVIKPGSMEKEQGRSREGRIFKINGADGALEQFVKFLELMQLKDWSLYPYLNGAYQGHQVTRTEECAYRFSTCPFSDDQLVYYFNNYNNGLFQSIF